MKSEAIAYILGCIVGGIVAALLIALASAIIP